jgi:hypothetical protein
MNTDYANKDIIDLLEVNYSEADGKLYIKVKWHTGEETLIDAQALKANEPLRLANFLPMNPVEKLRSVAIGMNGLRRQPRISVVPLEG